MINDAAYWIALANLPGWGYLKINNLIIRFFHDNNISIEDFFDLPESEWANKFQLNQKEIDDLTFAKSELVNNSFLAESLINQGYEIFPITSPEYSKTL